MIKFTVGILLVVFTTYCGRCFAKKYRLRKAFFEQADSFNIAFLEELNYTKRPFEEFSLKGGYSGDFKSLIYDEMKRREMRKTSMLTLEEYSFLTSDERRFFSEYFAAIGKGDSLSQKAYYSRAENSIKSLKIQAVEECKKHLDLYTKMGFILGLAILIILM